MPPLGRYSPCLCGSGKKYKFCCEAKPANRAGDKLSQRLIAIAGEPLHQLRTHTQYSALLKAVGLGWNLAVLEANGLHKKVDEAVERIGDLLPVVQEFADRKRELFPDDLRLLVDIQVVETSDGFDVRVAHMSDDDAAANEATA